MTVIAEGEPILSRRARRLRRVHSSIGVGELGCLAYLWLCALSGRRDRTLRTSMGVLAGEGVALVAAKGCPLGIFQRRAGDDVPMFELWFGPRLAPFAIPTFTALAMVGMALVVARPPRPAAVSPVQFSAAPEVASGPPDDEPARVVQDAGLVGAGIG